MALVPDGVEAFDTDVPDVPPQRYLVFFAPTFMRESQALSRASLDVNDHFQIKACGRDGWQVRELQAEVHDIYDRARLSVGGMNARVFLRSTTSVTVDRSKSPHISHATDLYHYRATPA